MDGRQRKISENERPISKPSFPLPVIFDREKLAEAPTLRRPRERVRFYRKPTRTSVTPTYDFVITTDPVEHKITN